MGHAHKSNMAASAYNQNKLNNTAPGRRTSKFDYAAMTADEMALQNLTYTFYPAAVMRNVLQHASVVEDFKANKALKACVSKNFGTKDLQAQLKADIERYRACVTVVDGKGPSKADFAWLAAQLGSPQGAAKPPLDIACLSLEGIKSTDRTRAAITTASARAAMVPPSAALMWRPELPDAWPEYDIEHLMELYYVNVPNLLSTHRYAYPSLSGSCPSHRHHATRVHNSESLFSVCVRVLQPRHIAAPAHATDDDARAAARSICCPGQGAPRLQHSGGVWKAAARASAHTLVRT